ncbi:uncharacterized protein N7515_009021 [Penicillium bovifimosum]|uniref:DUF7514 domain-containing protein n=1 Tax=Penicillium bovifimosum TaxID=126998 RepID=A0A9W9GIT0_9EURO|nr:uncharacterized protein N7515_009021 [Penicillium bovifimosum]KAJ5121060.1 hypothetical protein N7515_009021 [Penicillium bovifimosum]
MASADIDWGTLINSDKSPAPLLEQLCLGIAQLMHSFDSKGTADITPERLATFYRKVGGNYDPLFLETKGQALSFIYQSLGCFHSLQPSANPYEPPSVPALLPNGFVRWQTIQLLMDPDEHSVYLQRAVSLWDIADANGVIFPKTIPRDAFPSEPDPEMLQWHEGVSRRLEQDFVKRHTKRASPPDFGTYHYHFSGKDPLPDEDDYFTRPRAVPSRNATVMPSLIGLVANVITADITAENILHSPGKEQDGLGQDSPHQGFPLRLHGEENTHRVRGAVTALPDDSAHEYRDHPSTHRHRERRHLSPPSNSNGRRHSHEAYTRRPFRDDSPTSPHRHRRGHDSHSSRSSKSHSDTSPKVHKRDHKRDTPKDRSRSRAAGVKFRESIFGGPSPTPVAPEPPFYRPPTPPRAVPRHMGPHADEMRRGSYSGTPGNSRPSSGGSGSERQRAYSSAGFHHHPVPGWTSPRPSAKRYPVPENGGYVPSRRVPIYE